MAFYSFQEVYSVNERLDAAMDNWLLNYKKNSVKPATYDRLRISFEMMKRYSISSRPVSEVTADDIQLYLNQLVDDEYSRSTIKKQFTLLTAFLKNEYSQGRIKNPVYVSVKLPVEEVMKKPTKQLETYSQMDQKRLLAVLNRLEYRNYGALILMLEAGLRSGEAQCLTWDDVLWEQKAVRINKTMVRSSIHNGSTFVQHSAKSKTSNRTIPLSQRALDTLKSLYESAGNTYGFIFPDADDCTLPISYCAVRYYLKKACRDAGIKYRSAHALRHSFASNCYYRGCNVKVLSKLLGHADVAITYNIYIHLYGNELEEMRKVIG